ncbi:MAG: LPS-assembly protein LptD [Pseudomonadota bacterium]
MTSDRARTPLRPVCALAGLFALALGLVAPAGAQDSNAEPCDANGTNLNSECVFESLAKEEATDAAGGFDWVPISEVPEALRDRQCVNCRGRYIDPLADESKATPPEESSIYSISNASELEGETITLTGGVSASQGYRRLEGDTAIINRAQDSATIEGNVTLREPGVLLRGEKAKIYSDSGEAILQTSQFVFHQEHIRGTADLLERREDGMVHIHDGNFSYCAPGEDDWAIRAEQLDLDLPEGLATAHNARIEVEGVPIFYTPWLRFPLDDRRRTGFLWADFGNDSTGGLDITVPFYMNLAPNYDALYSPRYIEERGLNHQLLLRYLNPTVGQWSFGGAYMNKDDRYEDQVADNRSTDRWLVAVEHNGLFNQRWRSRVDYSKASDVDYIKDLETTNLESQRRTSLLQLASVDYLGKQWLLNLQAQQFQSLADDINDDYKKLPQFNANYRGSGDLFTLQPVFFGQLSNFETDEDNLVIGKRAYGEAGVTYPMRWLWGFLQPTVKYRQLYYDLSDATVFPDDSPRVGAPLASLDGGLVFERNTAMAGRELLQTLEPRLFYLYSEFEDQRDQPDFDSAELTFSYNQLYRETRFSGHDRIDDANQIAVGLSSSLIDATDGRTLLTGSLGQIYYFRDRKVRLLPIEEPLTDSGSEIAGELTFNPTDQLSLRTSLVYDPFEDRMDSANFQTHYRLDNGAIFNVGYSFRRPLTATTAVAFGQPTTEEASVSTYLPLTHNWSVFGAINYSLEADTSVEDMIGVEYDSCCWTVRLLYLRYFNNEGNEFTDFDDPNLERENTTQFQIILKGMGGFGDRITNIMEDLIRGFEERDY